MRHRKKHGKFHRKRDQRIMLIRGLAENLIRKGKIKTTKAKGKALVSLVSKLITKAKKNDFNSYRYVKKFVSLFATKKLHNEIAINYKERNGGYLRIIKLPPRKSDSSEMVIVEFV